VKVTDEQDRFVVRVISDTYAKSVEITASGLDCIWSDNYFDITSEDGNVIYLYKKETIDMFNDVETLKTAIQIRSVADTY
jgi:beta-mannosidase